MNPDLEKFCALVLEDRNLFDQLRRETNVSKFVELVTLSASQRHCLVTPEEVRLALHERRRAWRERWI